MSEDKTPTDIIVQELEDLEKKDFKKFKHKLSDFRYEGTKRKIPRGKLENADEMDVASLLIEFYGEDSAVNVAIEIFTKIGLKNSAVKLQEEKETVLIQPQSTRSLSVATLSWKMTQDYRPKYKEHIREKYQLIEERNNQIGECVELNTRYTKLLIVKEHRDQKERKHEIRAKGKEHAEIMAKRASSTKLETLFDASGNRQTPLRTFVLQGAAGIGKTMLAKKLMVDWAFGKLYPGKFDYIFYINSREMNCISERRSVADLILNNCPDRNAPIKDILVNPEKLLFIIDGFDVLKFSFDQQESSLCTDPCQTKPVEIILSSLLRKTILPKSYLIITTRPTALDKLRQCLKFPHIATILGFSEEDRKEYFCKFFANAIQAKQALDFVKENEMLFTMCFAPIVCWILCTVMKQQMESGEDLAKSSKTTTSVYMLFLSSLLDNHSTSKESVHTDLKKLCSLAADGILNNKILFEEEDARKHGLDGSDIQSLFLTKNIFQKDIGFESIYSFIHLSFQEFFAALFYLLVEDEEKGCDSVTLKKDVNEILKNYGKSRDNSLTLTVRFLFGLLNKERMNHTEKIFGCKISPEIKQDLLKWFGSVAKRSCGLTFRSLQEKRFQLELLHCLYEIQEEEFVKSAMDHFQEIGLSNINFTKIDHMVLSFCIKNCRNEQSLSLNDCTFGLEEQEERQESVLRKLVPWELAEKEPKYSPPHLLCQALKDLECKLKKISLGCCRLTSACCEDLASALKTNQSLKELDLSGNKLGETGIKLLCKGLKHQNCGVQKLGLRGRSLTATSLGDLASVLTKNQSLTELDLSYSKWGDLGVKLLYKALKHPNCKLQKIKLECCLLTAACCDDLASVLTTNQTLTELDLRNNELRDSGVKHLCAGLKRENCKIQKLVLSNCYFTGVCCGAFSAVLSKSQSLRELDVCYNKLGDAGMKLLCDGLRQPDCKLQKLRLTGCGLTPACCEDLSVVITTNQSLTELNINHDALGDSGMKRLHDGLNSTSCKLQMLILNGEAIKRDGDGKGDEEGYNGDEDCNGDDGYSGDEDYNPEDHL
ncbi:NACHT, LRR and PYD domains-containing protein 3-like [Chelonoidis abingdonii]|uniref:NACHT, LRR and PYD domains-containing protein 3-like n=1 Tax=Chelonoidis abingdonii TaxID=106734 RepID=UPI003F495517